MLERIEPLTQRVAHVAVTSADFSHVPRLRKRMERRLPTLFLAARHILYRSTHASAYCSAASSLGFARRVENYSAVTADGGLGTGVDTDMISETSAPMSLPSVAAFWPTLPEANW